MAKAPKGQAETSAKAFDMASALRAAENVAELPKGNHAGRPSQADGTPVPGWLQDTYDNNYAKAVTVPEEQVKTLASLIRSAANSLNLGARVRPHDNGDGTVTLTFKGADKRARKTAEKTQ